MNKKVIIAIVLAVLLGIGGAVFYFFYFNQGETDNSKDTAIALDAKKESTHLSRVGGAEGAYFMRGFDIVWNSVETKEGKYDWKELDQRLEEELRSGEEIYHLSIIWPYANWDQNTCHEGEKYLATGHLKRGGEDLMMGVPCDLEKYGAFVQKVVERYDGDGVDDMPGLKRPIKYWEVLNEPSMHGGSLGGAGEDLKFFVGTSEEYFDILKTSYEAIKKADSGSYVLHAGMAGMQQNFQDFWDPIFELGAGDYFDIANIHSISTTTQQEDLYIIKFKKYLESFGVKDKPIWVTEAQYGDLQGEPENLEKFEELMARSVVFALAQGADKIFLIENWLQWSGGVDGPEFKDKEEDIDYMDEEKLKDEKKKEMFESIDSSTHNVYLNLVKMLGSFDKVETIYEKYIEGSDDYHGATSSVGQYKFTNGESVVYALWGNAPLPPELVGEVTVTDIYGIGKAMSGEDIKLTSSPVFVTLN